MPPATSVSDSVGFVPPNLQSPYEVWYRIPDFSLRETELMKCIVGRT